MGSKKLSLKLDYDEEKIKAIRVALADKNKNLDAEIVKFFDGLYEKNVPRLLKMYIENGLKNDIGAESTVSKIEGESDFKR